MGTASRLIPGRIFAIHFLCPGANLTLSSTVFSGFQICASSADLQVPTLSYNEDATFPNVPDSTNATGMRTTLFVRTVANSGELVYTSFLGMFNNGAHRREASF